MNPSSPLTLSIALLLSGLASYGIADLASRYARFLGLNALPNHRSSHTQLTPQGGGIGIVLISLFWGIWLYPEQKMLWTAATVLAMVGLYDDRYSLKAGYRLGIHIFCVGALLCSGPLDMQALFFLPALVWWINLFNFMDGIDGLATTQALFMSLAALMIGTMSQPGWADLPLPILMLFFSSSVMGFLLINWSPARIFMGDVGSTFIAFFLGMIAYSSMMQQAISLYTWMMLGAVFIIDASGTLLYRIVHQKAWTQAHHEHLYQRLSRYWNPLGQERVRAHRRVTLLYTSINLFWVWPWAYWIEQEKELFYAIPLLMLGYAPLCYLFYKSQPVK